MKTDYSLFCDKISVAKTSDDCDNLDRSLTRLWNNGIFTKPQFIELDLKICMKRDLIRDA